MSKTCLRAGSPACDIYGGCLYCPAEQGESCRLDMDEVLNGPMPTQCYRRRRLKVRTK